ncbi:hypothetical protein RvY_19274 [Ramazzottius varieornatus]|uniref:Protein SMG9 n=1 Tax=Ramazzottius varieornatus TaxID=947166 RepID=A0A1D1W8V3_RAMVA|nr:hypothetical protein RvY_19274 [Ramazzottius varieornatus]
MEEPNPDLPRGMLRIKKRGEDAPTNAPATTATDASPNLSTTHTTPEQPRRGVLRISTSELSAASSFYNQGRGFGRPRSPPGRGYPPRGRPRNPQVAPPPRTPRQAISQSQSHSPVRDVAPPRPTIVARPSGILSSHHSPARTSTSTTNVSDSRPSGPVFGSDFATQEIFKALEQAKPTTIPRPPIPELTEEEKNDPNALREFYLCQFRMLLEDTQYLRNFKMTKPVKIIDSYFFWSLKKDAQLEHLIEGIDPFNTNYQVVGVIGLQGTGKSTVLSHLIDRKDVFETSDHKQSTNEGPRRPWGKFRTEGIDCYISREHRTIFLDAQPVYSGSVLEEMIIGDRKPPTVSSEHVFVEHTVELQSIMFGAFVLSVCHKVLVVMKEQPDPRLLRFLRMATLLKLGPVHKESLTEASLLDHWPELIFVNNFCGEKELYSENVYVAEETIAKLMKDYPLRYNQVVKRKNFMRIVRSDEEEESRNPVKMFNIPDTEAMVGEHEEYLKEEHGLQLKKLKKEVVGSLPMESVTPGIPMTEKEWFRYSKKCWAAVCKAPLINSIAKELNISNSV